MKPWQRAACVVAAVVFIAWCGGLNFHERGFWLAFTALTAIAGGAVAGSSP